MKTVIIFLCIFLSGCASSKPNMVGSRAWLATRHQEIQTAYDNKEITKAEYIRLKNESDLIRATTAAGQNQSSQFHYDKTGKLTGWSL